MKQQLGYLRCALCAVVALSIFAPTAYGLTRPTVDLDGAWRFATDPGDAGETARWFARDVQLPAMPLPGYAPEANGTIVVPGNWDSQGYGTETDKVLHNFVGKGWYKRQVAIPESWTGRRAFLVITGASRYTKVWVNEHFLGEHIGYLSEQEYDITPLIAPGAMFTVTIQADSKQRWAVDALYGASLLADFMDVPWGGIWGHVRLEARADAWLSDLFVQPDAANSACNVNATLNGAAAAGDAAKFEVLDKDGRCVAEAAVPVDPAGQTLALHAALAGAQLWTPDSPTLYTARLSVIRNGHSLDSIESRFGMRQFSTDGPYMLLNGKRLMLRGYGDDHIYPEQMGMPSDKELHLNRLRLIKSYGFNHVRHHSTVMPPEYYEACDELGIITTAEFPIVYAPFLPGVGSKWLEMVPPGTDPASAIDTYRREWSAVIRQFRNHPSILCWVMGNELGQCDDLPKPTQLFADISHQLDPQRMFLDSDGVRDSVLMDPKNDRKTLDFYAVQFNEGGADPIAPSGKFNSPRPLKPSLSHEAGNYVTFSRPDLIDQFEHNVKPFWLTDGKTKLAQLGLAQEAMAWAEKSERLYALLHKYNVESLRKNPYLCGYHWWLFQDYWTSSNGLVDHYFRPKSITPEEVLRFNNDVVLLQDGLQRTYRGAEPFALKLLISNYLFGPLEGTLKWKVEAGGHAISENEQPLSSAVLQGELATVAEINAALPEIDAPAKLNVSVELAVADGKHYSNSWTAWLYPAVIRRAEASVPVFAEGIYLEQFPSLNLQAISPSGELDAHAVYLTSWPCDPRIAGAMKRGAGVVLIEGAGLLIDSRPITYRSSWWRADGGNLNHTGTFVYDDPIVRAIAPDGWCDEGWWHLVEGATRFNVEKTPARPKIIVRALPGMMSITDYALLFEVGVEKGTLYVSGLAHRNAKGRPESEWIVARLLDAAARFEQPECRWPASVFEIASVAPEGCVPGFQRVVANGGEEGTWFSFREENARALICRQDQPGRRIAWETAPVPADASGERVTFAFAGGLGYASEPKTEGFVLEINGTEALRFDLPEPASWRSEDKRIELKFESRRTVSTWSTISHASRSRLKPDAPVAQNVQPIAQPDCELTQTTYFSSPGLCVRGIRTVSNSALSFPRKR